MSTNPPSDPAVNASGAEPVYGPAYTGAAVPDAGSGTLPAATTFSAATPEAGPVPPLADGPSPPYTAPYPPYPSDTPPTYGLDPKMASGLAYVTLVPAVFFLLIEPYKSNRRVRFHSWQSVFFFLAVAAVRAVESVLNALLPIAIAFAISSVLSLILLTAWLVAVVQAFSGKAYRLPWIGQAAAKVAEGKTF